MSSNSHSFVTFIHLTIDSVFQGKFEYKQTLKLLSKKKKKSIKKIFLAIMEEREKQKSKNYTILTPNSTPCLNFFFNEKNTGLNLISILLHGSTKNTETQ